MNNFNSSKSVADFLRNSISEVYSREEAQAISFLALNHLYGLSKIDVLQDKRIGEREGEVKLQILEIADRLKRHEPIQYILGQTEFYGCLIKVNPFVLIPRRETEELVDLIIKENKERDGLRVLDICTGSGCIPIALQKNLKQADIYALDISSEALVIAGENAKFNSASSHFEQCDILTAELPWVISFDLIVSNPPYVLEREKAVMQNNVLEYEPHIALFVEDNDPLIFYRRIIEIAVRSLREGGRLYFEINEKFGQEVSTLMQENQLSDIAIVKDLQGKDRFVLAKKPF